MFVGLLGLAHAEPSPKEKRIALSAMLCDQQATLRAAGLSYRSLSRFAASTGVDLQRARASAGGAASRTVFEMQATRKRLKEARQAPLGCGSTAVASLIRCVNDDFADDKPRCQAIEALRDLYMEETRQVSAEALDALDAALDAREEN